jgi:hypothetical protein
MTIAPTIYDWPAAAVRFRDGFFRVAPQVVDGGMTLSSALIAYGVPGGRAMLQVDFATLPACAGGLGSWLATMMATQAVFRVPIRVKPQLLSAAELGIADDDGDGIDWDNGQPWDNGFGWAFEPGIGAVAAVAEGSTVLSIGAVTFDPSLFLGRATGAGAYLVMAAVATDTGVDLTVTPPLRADVAIGDFVTFRPNLLATVQDASAFLELFRSNRWFQPGSITFVEALV